jgi:hypothetical protein
MPAIMTPNNLNGTLKQTVTILFHYCTDSLFTAYYPIQCYVTSKAERVEEESAVSTFNLQIEIAGSYEMLVKSQNSIFIGRYYSAISLKMLKDSF